MTPGVHLSFKELVNALLYKCKYSKDQLAEFSESELDSLDRKLHIAASAVRGCRNSMQKINQLPPELLFNILSSAQLHLPSFLPDLSVYEDHGREWYSLLHVCRLWRGIIARSPSLWSTVDNTILQDKKHNVAYEQYLLRSGGAPLTVYLGVKELTLRKKTLLALLKHLPRFRQLHITADLWEDSSSAPLYSHFTAPAPNLVSLTIRTDGKDVVGGSLPPIFVGEMPRLTQLSLEHFTSWPSTYFHNLTALSLSDQAFNRPTTLAFLEFISNSPQLETLALVRAGPTLSPNSDLVPPRNQIYSFPKLKHLSLGGWPTTMSISRFLSFLELTEETDVYIWGSVFGHSDADLEGLVPEDTTRLRNLGNVTRWYLTHFSVAQPGDLLYVPFTAIVRSVDEGEGEGSTTICPPAHSTSTPTSSSSATTVNALHNYGVFRASQLLAALPRYPLHNITTFVLRDSSYQANRFRPAVWAQVFSRLTALEELRILAYQSTTTTRSVLTALLPVVPGDGERDEGRDEDNGEGEGDNGEREGDNGERDAGGDERGGGGDAGGEPSPSSSPSPKTKIKIEIPKASTSQRHRNVETHASSSSSSTTPRPGPSSSHSRSHPHPHSRDQFQSHSDYPPSSSHVHPNAEPFSPSSSLSSSTSSFTSPLKGDHSRCKVLCPNLRSLTIEHDPDLASIFISKVIKARRDHGCPIERLRILVFDPPYGVGPSSPREREERGGGGGGGQDGNGGNGPQNNNNATTNNNNLNQHATANPNTNAHTTPTTNTTTNANAHANPTTAHNHTTTNANHTTSTTAHTHTHANHTTTLFLNPAAHSSSSSISSTDILNEEYNLRSREDEELLRRYVVGEVRFEYKKPLSQDLVPRGWPTDAYKRTFLPYSF
ncbi:hypothetical protein D9757_007678 [Collybiopsis confluens]|uniref:F-box domain-containing protein n=1 Tax=Collybiopsis confluens TaxID=2823264 RepID=A0A8H5H9C9_9AGAR|nr:hypothetical protein D9757_007678 [Collybiopsis confluens]